MEIEIEAEIVKLSRLLGRETAELAFLRARSPGALRAFRRELTRYFHARQRDRYRRLAGMSKLLPAGVSARLATRLLGPTLAAGVAAELEPRRAVKLAEKLPVTFLAELCQDLDPEASRDLLVAMPDALVEAVARQLLAGRAFITLASFVNAIRPSALARVLATLEDGEAMVKIGLYLEDRARLGDVLGMLRDGQRRAVLQAASEHELWPAVLGLTAHLDLSLRAAMGDLLAEQGETVLTRVVELVAAQRLWSHLLGTINAMTPARRSTVINLPIVREPSVMESLIGTVVTEDSWDALLPIVPQLDDDHLARALDVLVERVPEALTRALERGRDDDHVALLRRLSADELTRVATAAHERAPETFVAFVTRNPGLVDEQAEAEA